VAHIELAAAAVATDDRAVSKEFFALFIGLGRGELLPYASYYMTGFLHERRWRVSAKIWMCSNRTRRRVAGAGRPHRDPA